MIVDYQLSAEARTDVGKGASRRLRRAGKVPVVIYGAHREPENLTLNQNEVIRQLQNEGFYSHILTLVVGSRSERAILRDMQRHPFKPSVLHMDFQRVSEDEKIRVQVPLHFINEDLCKGVKQEGGAISHLLTEVEIICLPKDLPEFVEVDLAELGLGESIHLSEVQFPEGVEVPHLAQGGDDMAIANVHHAIRAAEPEEGEAAEDDEAAAEGGDEDA